MLIKEKDSIDEAIRQLEEISSRSNIPENVAKKASKELKTLKSGIHGESNSAYFINFHYENNPNWAIIHDLRFEYQGFVAQIDHLLINRYLEFYVLESKNYANGIKITDGGEFLVWYNRYIPIESPIEQNRRHVIALERLLKGENLLPTRLGITLHPDFRPYVLISPKSKLIRPNSRAFDTSMVIKADILFRQIEADFDNASTISTIGSVAKMVSRETIMEMAQKLVSFHKPVAIDYFERFNIQRPKKQLLKGNLFKRKSYGNGTSQQSGSNGKDELPHCFNCGQPVSKKVAQYCRDKSTRFDGKVYCFQCQRIIKKPKRANG